MRCLHKFVLLILVGITASHPSANSRAAEIEDGQQQPRPRQTALIDDTKLILAAPKAPLAVDPFAPPPDAAKAEPVVKPEDGKKQTEQNQPEAPKPEPAKAEPAKAPPLKVPALKPAIARRALQIQVGNAAAPLVAAGPSSRDNEAAAFAIFPSNREQLTELNEGRDLVRQERYSDAARVLDRVLQSEGDYFFQPDREVQSYRSLKSEARRAIGAMPAQGLEAYDLQFGATAQQLLDQAITQSDSDRLAEVSRRFFHTKAGFEATWLLGRHHLDHGEPLAAAMALEILYETPRGRAMFDPSLSLLLATSWQRAGDAARAQTILVELKRAGGAIRLADRAVSLFENDAQAIPWLIATVGGARPAQSHGIAQWIMARGNPSRNGVSSGGSPLLTSPRWQQTIDPPRPGPFTTDMISNNSARSALSKQLSESNVISFPAEVPLATSNWVLLRTTTSVVGVDFATGKRIWDYETWDSEDRNARQQVMNPMTGTWLQIQPEKLTTRNTIASDGQRVYTIEDRGNQPFNFNGMFNPWMRTNQGPQISATNKLLARDLTTQGKLLWEVGGGSTDYEKQLSGVYFLGAPLVMLGQLYIIGENKQEITLYVLDAASGKLQWQQPLASVETSVGADSFRRLHGVTPSFADGVLICPTSAGAVVAIDLTNRSLLWGYQYSRNQGYQTYTRVNRQPTNPFSRDRWIDGTAILSNGRVVITPVDSDQLHCLNLSDGRLTWSIPRADNLYVAGIHDGVAAVVGKKDIRGFKVHDGAIAWEPAKLAGGGTTATVPSGRGFLSGGHYFVPLSSAEVIKVDLADGLVKARAKSRKGYVPGNLVCYQGSVLSQTDDSLDCFFQLDEREQWAARTLQSTPNDPTALAMFGEILVDQGKLDEGLLQLTRAFGLDGQNPQVRTLLIEAHLEALRLNFSKHRAQLSVIEALLTEPEQRVALARQMALGLQAAGDNMAAFEAFVKMCQPGDQPAELEPLPGGELSVRRDRWVQARINELRAAASADDRIKMDTLIRVQAEQLAQSKSVDDLRRFLSYFGAHESATDVRARLIAQLGESRNWLEAEWLVLQGDRGGDAPQLRATTLQLAELMMRAGRADEAAKCYRRLAGPWSKDIIRDGQTGREIVEALPADSLVRPLIAATMQWPTDVIKSEPGPKSLNYFALQLDVTAGREPFMAEQSLEIDQQSQELVGRDGLGHERFRIPIADPQKPARSYSGWGWSRATGHLVIVQLGTQVLAIDTLGASKDGKARVLWRHDVSESLSDNNGAINTHWQIRNGRRRPQLVDQNGQPVGGIWPVGNDMVCLQRGQKLLAIDALTGQVLWTRQDMRATAEIFGDAQHLFVVPPNSQEATVLRALDGHKLSETRKIPTGERLFMEGRNIVTMSNVDGRALVAIHDLWNNQELWKKQFQSGAKTELVGGDELAVLDNKGQFAVVSLVDGKPIVDSQVDPEPSLSDLQVFRTQNRYVITSSRPFVYKQGSPHVYQIQNNGNRANPIINGRVYGFDRVTGKLLWANDLGPTAHVLNQVGSLPVLVFAANVNEQLNIAPGNARQYTQVICLDVRDGKQLTHQKLTGSTSMLVVTADPVEKSLEFRASSSSVKVTFGEQGDDAKAGDGKPANDTPAVK